MHPLATRHLALELLATGLDDGTVAARLHLPRTTIRDWRRAPPRAAAAEVCPRCWRATTPVALSPADYAELLGLYLGDGHITTLPRTQRLRLSLDARHSGIVADAEALLSRGSRSTGSAT
jgi:hypothetical protein